MAEKTVNSNIDISVYMPELLDDIWALGGSPEVIVTLLRQLNLSAGKTRDLDLGYGKGAISILIAQKLGFQVLGVDICDPFLDFARDKAKVYMVSHLCQFKHADIFEILKSERDFNAVILASLGSILGSYDQSVAKLRQVVRPGGYIIIDDGYLKGNKPVRRSDYKHYVNHQLTIKQLTSRGDKIVDQFV